jgi:hypothetical protein
MLEKIKYMLKHGVWLQEDETDIGYTKSVSDVIAAIDNAIECTESATD